MFLPLACCTEDGLSSSLLDVTGVSGSAEEMLETDEINWKEVIGDSNQAACSTAMYKVLKSGQ